MSLRANGLITDFSAGETSPRWRARVQGGQISNNRGATQSLAEMYRSGCERLTNAFVLSQGGVVKRQGVRFGALPDVSSAAVLNNGDNYRTVTYRQDGLDRLLVVLPTGIQVYDVTARPFVLLDTVSPLPYSEAELASLHFVQGQDELLFLSGTWRPRIFRYNQGVYEFIDPADDDGEDRFVPPVYRFRDTEAPPSITSDWDITFIPGTPSQERRRFVVSVSGVASSTDSRWYRDNPINTLRRIETALKDNPAVKPKSVAVTEITPNDGTAFNVRFDWVVGEGNSTGILDVDWEDPPNDTWDLNVEANEALSAGGEPLWSGPLLVLHSGTYYECIQANRSEASNEPGTGGGAAYWASRGASVPTDQDYTVDSEAWAVDKAYSTYDRGWPTVGTFHEQRLMLNGGTAKSGVLAGSKTSQTDYLDFTLGLDASNGLLFAIANDKGVRIEWMLSQRKLFLGTTAGLYVQEAVPLTPTNVNLQRHSMHRSASLPALAVAGEVFHVQDNLRQVRKVQYVRDIDSWEARDLTVLAEHLFREEENIKAWTFVDSPDPLIFAVRADGALMSMAYQESYGVTAWSKHNVADKVLDVTAVFDGVHEHLILLIQRQEWNGSAFVSRPTIEILEDTTRNLFIESPVFDPQAVESEFELAVVDAGSLPVYLDSYTQFTGNGSTNGIQDPRFANRIVSVMEDGVFKGSYQADFSGNVQLDTPSTAGSTLSVGYAYPAIIRPNKLDITSNEGSSQSQKVRWTRPVLRLITSAVPKLNGVRAPARSQDTTFDANSLFTGDLEVVNLGSETGLTIEADLPLPFQLSGIFGVVTVESR